MGHMSRIDCGDKGELLDSKSPQLCFNLGEIGNRGSILGHKSATGRARTVEPHRSPKSPPPGWVDEGQPEGFPQTLSVTSHSRAAEDDHVGVELVPQAASGSLKELCHLVVLGEPGDTDADGHVTGKACLETGAPHGSAVAGK